MKKGSITLGDVTISWRLRWSGSMDDTGDWDSERRDDIRLSSANASIEDVSRALYAAKQLDWSRAHGMMLGPSGSALEAIGISEIGSVILQIYKDDEKKSAAPASDLAHLDPAHYSNGGQEAMSAVAWMRDVAKAVRDCRSKRELNDALYAARQAVV